MGACRATRADDSGSYALTGFPAGVYRVTGWPVATDTVHLQTVVPDVIVLADQTVVQDVVMRRNLPIAPGSTELTRMLCGPPTRASARVKPITAPLLVM